MKPLHSNIIRLSRCPCCQSKYSAHGMRAKVIGKKAARAKDKRDLKKEIS